MRSSPPSDVPSTGEADLGRRERNKLEKQHRIISAATELFKEHGFDDTTTAAIAKRAGVGAGTLYLYVESKEDLLAHVFQIDAGAAWQKAFELVDETEPVIDQVVSVLIHVLQHHDRDPRLSRAYFKELAFVSASVRPRVSEFTGSFIKSLANLLDAAVERGEMSSSARTVSLAELIFSSWYWHMQRLFANALDADVVEKRIATSVDAALSGLLLQPRS